MTPPTEAPAAEPEADDQVHDAEIVEPDEPRRAAEVVRAAPARLAVTPDVSAGDLVERLATIREAMESAMTKGVDYGEIPGTDKPALFKPGSEKLGVLFQLDVQILNRKTWGPGAHLTVVSEATVFHAPTGVRIGSGEGVCSTHERKYGIRKMNRTCPDCGAEAILLSRDETEGFFCWRKKGGCGHQFKRDDQRLTSQEEGEKENPDLADTWNTVVKMAAKRARVDAILATTGASALFTQDVEDQAPPEPEPPAEASAEQKTAASAALTALLGDSDRARAAWGKIKAAQGGILPAPVADALAIAAGEVAAAAKRTTQDRDAEQPDQTDLPPADPPPDDVGAVGAADDDIPF